MSWGDEHGLATRLSDLPLILCSQILRHTEPDPVSVWVDLKASRSIILRVYSRAPLPGPESLREELRGTRRRTVRLSEHLHIAAISAQPVAADRQLVAGELYFYNLFFSDAPVSKVPKAADQLKTVGVVDPEKGSSLEDLEPSNISYSILDWAESLPEVTSNESLKTGERTRIVKHVAKFTSEDTKNHALRFGKYSSLYRFGAVRRAMDKRVPSV